MCIIWSIFDAEGKMRARVNWNRERTNFIFHWNFGSNRILAGKQWNNFRNDWDNMVKDWWCWFEQISNVEIDIGVKRW
jgi:hypothetical protein